MSPVTKKFFSYYKPYLPMFLVVLFCALLASSATLVFPLLVRFITKNVLEGDLTNALSKIFLFGVAMTVLIIVQNLATYFSDYKGHEIGARMESDLRSELFAQMQKLSFSFYDKERTGHLMSRISNDLLNLAEFYHHGPEDYVRSIVRIIGAFIILMMINAPLTIAVFCFIPVLSVLTVYFNKKLNRTLRDNKERIADVNAQVEDSLSGIRVVKSFANEEVEIKHFNRANDRLLESRKSTYKAEAVYFNIFEALIQMITVTIIIFGSIQMINAKLDLADLITFLLYIGFITEPIRRMAHMTTQLQDGLTGFQRFIEIINLRPDIESKPNAMKLSYARGEIAFKNVTFRYDKHLEDVLHNMSFRVKSGEYIALVGPSGAGKTTTCSLIPRFYDVTDGQVLLDGIDVRDIDLHDLRKNIGVVHQDVYLFSGTVVDNIRYGKPDARMDEIIVAANKANAHDFIMNLPHGYDTEIGQRGVRLSGGQKQRLSIARVFLKNPPILLFDEATSSLDNESESVIQESLETLAKGRTTIVIAHRLSTIQNAERIIVLTDEGIVEQGTHESLLAYEGVYAHLYAKQFKVTV